MSISSMSKKIQKLSKVQERLASKFSVLNLNSSQSYLASISFHFLSAFSATKQMIESDPHHRDDNERYKDRKTVPSLDLPELRRKIFSSISSF